MEERLVAVEHKTNQLEDVLQRFITHTNAALSELHREMLDFKGDMQAFKDEMRAFKDEMKPSKTRCSSLEGSLTGTGKR